MSDSSILYFSTLFKKILKWLWSFLYINKKRVEFQNANKNDFATLLYFNKKVDQVFIYIIFLKTFKKKIPIFIR